MAMVTALVFASLGMVAGAGARLLLGRLRRGARIGPPWCEVVLTALWGLCGWWWTAGRLPGDWLPLLLGLSWLAVAAGAVDLTCHRLPDALTLPALPVTLLLVAPLGPSSELRGAVGAVVLFGAHLAVRRAAPAAMGAGDVKLAAPLGVAVAAVSWPALIIWALLAALCTAAAALGAASARLSHGAAVAHHGPGTTVPHGPSMLVAGWLVVAAGALGAAGATPGPA
jgi:leader peptidase (prepilin peptidase)/N-methyltransferase